MEKMRFENLKGYSIVEDKPKSSWWTTIYEYTAKENPLTFVHSDGARYRPDNHFFTDQGSVPRFPPFIRMFVPKDRFLGFYLHDSGYAFGGLWINGAFRVMTRKQVDDLLYDMILADPIPGSKATAWLVWSHVRLYGGLAGWGKGDVGKPKPSNGSRINPHGIDGVLKKA
jgi:hypothetical protein